MAVKQQKFSDLDLSFQPHPATGDLVPLRGDRAVARAVRQIILTNSYEKLFNPSFGGNILSYLFENFTPQTDRIVKTKIQEALRDYEPRVEIVLIKFTRPDDSDFESSNNISISIQFRIKGQSEVTQLDFSLKRVR